jgi:hypothetical protein
VVIVVAVKLYHPVGVGNDNPVARKAPPAAQAPARSLDAKARPPMSPEDRQWLETVSTRPPAQLARFQSDLDQANAFIRDAQQSLQENPNDVYLQQMLINAYEQKQMLYELAVDNSGQ